MIRSFIYIMIILFLISCNVTTTDLASQCPSPVEVSVPREGQNSIILNWEGSSQDADEYIIERSLNENSGYGVIASLDILTNTYTDNNVSVSTFYYYRIIASNDCGDSDPSNVVNLSVEPPIPGASGELSFSNTTSESTMLIWNSAEDNVSTQNELEYKVVYSPEDNVDTLTNAEEYGIYRIDWMKDICSFEVESLTSNTTYYFNVLVRDEAGNTSIYKMSSVTPSNGVSGIGITVLQPEDETIDFSEENDFTVPAGSIMTINVPDLYDSYQWYLDGVFVDDEDTNIFTLDCSEIMPGVHHLSVFILMNSLLYSDTIRFTVIN